MGLDSHRVPLDASVEGTQKPADEEVGGWDNTRVVRAGERDMQGRFRKEGDLGGHILGLAWY